jgi:AcrR family transcriptional regulator
MARLAEGEREAILSETRAGLLRAAADEFARNGFSAANVNAIAAAAGFAVGTLYNHFPNKRAVMDALIDHVALAQTSAIRESVGQERDPRRRLLRFFEAGFRFVEDNPSEARVAIGAAYGADLDFRNRLYQAYDELFTLIIEDILVAGQKSNDFRKTDPYTTAALIMSVYLGASSQVDDDGKIWLEPRQVARFVRQGIER